MFCARVRLSGISKSSSSTECSTDLAALVAVMDALAFGGLADPPRACVLDRSSTRAICRCHGAIRLHPFQRGSPLSSGGCRAICSVGKVSLLVRSIVVGCLFVLFVCRLVGHVVLHCRLIKSRLAIRRKDKRRVTPRWHAPTDK